MPGVFLDYPVIDHLFRLDSGRYSGKHGAALTSLRQEAVSGNVSLWMSEIAEVEMAHGHQNPHVTGEKLSRAQENDRRKLLIASEMHVRWLTYPCAKLDDEYSLLDLSFRVAGPKWDAADALERTLEQVQGISRGDARHLVSWLFGTHTDCLAFKPDLPFFVSEDEALRNALVRVQPGSSNGTLREAKIRSVEALVSELWQRG